MLKVSPATVEAFVAANAAGRRFRFIGWMESYAEIVGPFQRDVLAGAFESFGREASEAGAESDRQRFIFTAAMLLMPEMTDAQYLHTLDIVFSDEAASICLERLLALKDRPGG